MNCRPVSTARPVLLALLASLLPGSAAAASPAAQEAEAGARVVRLTGRVVAAEGGEGVPGVVIRLFGRPGRHVTGADGRVSFDVPAGRHSLSAWKAGYVTVESTLPAEIPGRFTLVMHRLPAVDLSVPARLVVRVGESGSGRPVEGAAVSLTGGGMRVTDARGLAEFTDLSDPMAEVTVEMIGFRQQAAQISLRLERTTLVQMAMAVEAIGLEPLEVEVRSRFLEARGVYWRIDRGRVQHLLSREALDTLSTLTDGLKGLPGVRVEYIRGLPHVLGRRSCPVRVFLDGFPVFSDTNIDDVLPKEVEVAEIYLAERTPVQFGGIDNGCGAIVLWSRRKAGRGSRRWRYTSEGGGGTIPQREPDGGMP